MNHRSWKRHIWLLCGLLLVLPVAHAKKPQNEDNERQQTERAPPIRGGNLEKDNPRNSRYYDRPYEERRYAPQPRYDNNDRRSYDRSYDRNDDRRYDRYDNRYDDRGYAPAPRPRYAPRGMNLSEAVAEAERRTGGRVLSAEPFEDGGQPFYRVKVLTPNGRVKVLFLEAQ